MTRSNANRALVLAAAALVLPLSLAGCVGQTPYQPIGANTGTGGGYSDQRIAANRYHITFTGNQFTSRDRVDNYLLFRAAELTLRNGYDSFHIVRRDTDRAVDRRISRPFHTGPYGYWAPYWRFYGDYGWHYYDPYRYDPFFGGPVTVRNIERFQATAEIVMENGLHPDDPMSFDARDVRQNLADTIVYPA